MRAKNRKCCEMNECRLERSSGSWRCIQFPVVPRPAYSQLLVTIASDCSTAVNVRPREWRFASPRQGEILLDEGGEKYALTSSAGECQSLRRRVNATVSDSALGDGSDVSARHAARPSRCRARFSLSPRDAFEFPNRRSTLVQRSASKRIQ